MFSRVLGLIAFTGVLATGTGLLTAAGVMPWPVPFLVAAVGFLICGIMFVRRGPQRPRAPLLDDTEPAGIKPPPG